MNQQNKEYENQSCGDGLTFGLGGWKFDKSTATTFNKHAEKSIPGYRSSHELISIISDHFLVDNDIALDIGCSTGALLKNMSSRHKGKNCKYLGIDTSLPMINEARESNSSDDIEYSNISYLDLELDCKVDYITAIYVVQFIRPKERQEFLLKIYDDLNWGGAFVLFEKTRGNDSRFNEILSSAYWEWKRKNGFTSEEIFDKSRSLRGVMEPFTHNGTLNLLHNAGFVDIETCFKWGPFQGLLAIK